MGGLDFSPIVLMLVIYLLDAIVAQSLYEYGWQLKAPYLQGVLPVH